MSIYDIRKMLTFKYFASIMKKEGGKIKNKNIKRKQYTKYNSNRKNKRKRNYKIKK